MKYLNAFAAFVAIAFVAFSAFAVEIATARGPVEIAATPRRIAVYDIAALDTLEIGEDGLFDEPVRGALDLLGGRLEPRAEDVVDLDAKRGVCHGRVT